MATVSITDNTLTKNPSGLSLYIFPLPLMSTKRLGSRPPSVSPPDQRAGAAFTNANVATVPNRNRGEGAAVQAEETKQTHSPCISTSPALHRLIGGGVHASSTVLLPRLTS